MSTDHEDPWVDVKTPGGFAADQVISALQKEIRRGNAENAVLLAYEMVRTGTELEAYLWYRLMVIAVEDVGFGAPQAPVMIDALHRMLVTFQSNAGENILFAVHAVRYLCGCQKDRSSDEMAMWLNRVVPRGQVQPTIPDYALDLHTAAGRQMGRGYRHFLEAGARLSPEKPDRDLTYRNRLMEMLEQNRL